MRIIFAITIFYCTCLLVSCGSSNVDGTFKGVYKSADMGMLILDDYDIENGSGLARYVTDDRVFMQGSYVMYDDDRALYCVIKIDGLVEYLYKNTDYSYSDEKFNGVSCYGESSDGGITLICSSSYYDDDKLCYEEFEKDGGSPINFIIR